jgi:hypothetical protein
VDFSMKLNQSLAAAHEARGLLAQARWQLLVAEAAQALAEDEVVTARAPGRGTAAKRTSAQRTVAQLKATAAAASPGSMCRWARSSLFLSPRISGAQPTSGRTSLLPGLWLSCWRTDGHARSRVGPCHR